MDHLIRLTWLQRLVRRVSWIPAVLLPCLLPQPSVAQDVTTIRGMTVGMLHQDGFIPIHVDTIEGRLYLEVSLPGTPFLYNSRMASDGGLAFSVGSPNWTASNKVVRFERRGEHLILTSRKPFEQDSVRGPVPATDEVYRPFLQGSFPIVAEDGGRALVDATDWFVQDVSRAPRQGITGIPGRLHDLYGEQAFRFSRERSSIYLPATRTSPRREHFSDPTSFVARERHSLSPLPPEGMEHRLAGPRIRSGWPFISRWRLEKEDPSDPVSDVLRPIEVYLDPAMPDLVRSASAEGFRYWNAVFEKIGFRDAIQVRDLPADSDPLGPDYPLVVLWIPSFMSSSGWAFLDSRTSEVVTARISLDGYRETLETNAYRAFAPALCPGQPDLETVLLTMRAWLVAHEAAHVLAGMQHVGVERSMVGMHRPRLQVGLDRCLEMDLSVVMPPSPLPYDEWKIRYAYAPLRPGHEDEDLRQIVEDGLRLGLRYDRARAMSSNPTANMRIYNMDPLVILEEDMAVRRLVLPDFGQTMLQPGEPESLLFERLIPVYFHHRHALNAVAAMLGGADFGYDPENLRRVDWVIESRDQRQALEAMLQAISPEELLIPPDVAARIPARLTQAPVSKLEWPVREPGFFMHITDTPPLMLPLQAAGPFDPLGWAGVLYDLVMDRLLDPDRLGRVSAQYESEQTDLSVEEILTRTIDQTWGSPTPSEASLAGLGRLARDKVLDAMNALASDEETPAAVAQPTRLLLDRLLVELRTRETDDPAERAHLDKAVTKLDRVSQ